MAAPGRGIAPRLGFGVHAAFFRVHAGREALLVSRLRRAASLLADAAERSRRLGGNAARNRSTQLPARLYSAQGRSLHDGAWTRDARAVSRSPLRRRSDGLARADAIHEARQENIRAGTRALGRRQSPDAKQARLQSTHRG